ncbi:MAG: hypothetical protein VX589_05755 [Myxococcota bacterium]|nr:hypothetical protein [Myxococcota bacterium]
MVPKHHHAGVDGADRSTERVPDSGYRDGAAGSLDGGKRVTLVLEIGVVRRNRIGHSAMAK